MWIIACVAAFSKSLIGCNPKGGGGGGGGFVSKEKVGGGEGGWGEK